MLHGYFFFTALPCWGVSPQALPQGGGKLYLCGRVSRLCGRPYTVMSAGSTHLGLPEGLICHTILLYYYTILYYTMIH